MPKEMDQILYPFDPANDHTRSFAWIVELVGKTESLMIVLGNQKDLKSGRERDDLNTRILGLLGHYQTHYNRWEEEKPLPIKMILRNGLWPDLIKDALNDYAIGLTILEADFDPINNNTYDTMPHPFIRLPAAIPFGGFGDTEDLDKLIKMKNQTFFQTYYNAEKQQLPKEFFTRVSKDKGIFNFLLDHFMEHDAKE